MKTLFSGYFLCSLLTFSLPASATEVSVSGFGFAGNFASAAERFPYTYKLFEQQKASGQAAATFSYQVIQKARGITNPAFTFTPGDTVNLKNDTALMAVLMLTGETVAIDNHDTYHKTFINLRGDTLVFDYKNQAIIRSCPVNVVLFDATPQRPTDERIAGFVNNLIRRDDANGLIAQSALCLAKATPPAYGAKTIQVRKGVVAPEALALFPEPLRRHPEAANAMLAGSLSSILSTKLGLSMLPDSIGHAIGGVMSMRLENGDDIKLKLPEGDYVFDVSLNKFAKIKTAASNVSATYVYGAYMSLDFTEPMLGTSYIHTDLKNGEVAVVPAGQVDGDDFAAYQDAVRGLFLKFSDSVEKPNSKWLATAASVKTIESQLALARETLGIKSK
jgi:hypothetical protein